MTEIDVVKKSSHVWIWVLLALLVLAALFFFTRGSSDTRTGHLLEHGDRGKSGVALLMRA